MPVQPFDRQADQESFDYFVQVSDLMQASVTEGSFLSRMVSQLVPMLRACCLARFHVSRLVSTAWALRFNQHTIHLIPSVKFDAFSLVISTSSEIKVMPLLPG